MVLALPLPHQPRQWCSTACAAHAQHGRAPMPHPYCRLAHALNSSHPPIPAPPLACALDTEGRAPPPHTPGPPLARAAASLASDRRLRRAGRCRLRRPRRCGLRRAYRAASLRPNTAATSAARARSSCAASAGRGSGEGRWCARLWCRAPSAALGKVGISARSLGSGRSRNLRAAARPTRRRGRLWLPVSLRSGRSRNLRPAARQARRRGCLQSHVSLAVQRSVQGDWGCPPYATAGCTGRFFDGAWRAPGGGRCAVGCADAAGAREGAGAAPTRAPCGALEQPKTQWLTGRLWGERPRRARAMALINRVLAKPQGSGARLAPRAPGVLLGGLGGDAARRIEREQAAEQVEPRVGQPRPAHVQARGRREALAQRVLALLELELRAAGALA